MRIRKFVSAAPRGAFSLEEVKNRSPELFNVASNLSPAEVKKLILSRDFVPLDLVALIYHTNPRSFMLAIKNTISGALRGNSDYRRWLEIMGLTPEDVTGAIYTSIFSNDPDNRGALSEVMLDGSLARSYNYEKAKNSEIGTELRNSLQPTQGQLMVPHCPVCARAGIEKPLWKMKVENGTIVPEQGMKAERCTTIEQIESKKISDEELDQLMQTGEPIYSENRVAKISATEVVASNGESHFLIKLTPRQMQNFENHLRDFQITRGDVKYRCSFEAKIPSFSAFFNGHVIKGEVGKMWGAWKRQHGWTADLEKVKLLEYLEEKDKGPGLTPIESIELRKLRRYKEKKDKNFIPQMLSVDAPRGSEDEGARRTLHDTLRQDEDQQGFDFSKEELQNAQLELSKFLDEEELDLLKALKPTGNKLLEAISDLQDYFEEGSQYAQKAYRQTLMDLSKYYTYGPENKKGAQTQCQTCGLELAPQDKTCPMAGKMQKDTFESYHKAHNMQELEALIAESDPKVKMHYVASGIRVPLGNIMQTAIQNIEVDEDDLFEGIDLSSFEGYESEVEEIRQDAPKLNFNDFKRQIETTITKEERNHFVGTNVAATKEEKVETEKPDPVKIQENAKKIDQLIRRVEDEDLLEEFTILHRA